MLVRLRVRTLLALCYPTKGFPHLREGLRHKRKSSTRVHGLRSIPNATSPERRLESRVDAPKEAAQVVRIAADTCEECPTARTAHLSAEEHVPRE